MEYLSNSKLSARKYENFLQSDVLRREYLNQSFNFLPYVQVSIKESSTTQLHIIIQLPAGGI